MSGEFLPNEDNHYQFMIVEAPDYEVNSYDDSLYLFAELARIALEDYPGVIPIFRLYYGDK